MALEEIFYQSEHLSDKWQPYFEVYERHLQRFVGKPVTLVEVGIQKGGSLEMWSSFLGPQSRIIGIDVDPECINLKYKQSNIEVVIGNQSDTNFWDSFMKENSIDILIDDGGHFMHEQIITFEKVFPKMNMGGVYICEDTHTSYDPAYGGAIEGKNPWTFIEYAKGYIDILHETWVKEEVDMKYQIRQLTSNKSLSGIFFYDSMVVFEKFGKRNMNRVFSK